MTEEHIVNLNKSKQKDESKIISSFVFSFIFFALLIVVDQVVKYEIFSHHIDGGFILPFQNNNFAFSLHVPIVIIYLLYGVILVFILKYFFSNFKKFSSLELIAWLLILAGAFSNIGERIVLGYVRDFILILSGIFNLADFYIIGGILILLFMGKKSRRSG